MTNMKYIWIPLRFMIFVPIGIVIVPFYWITTDRHTGLYKDLNDAWDNFYQGLVLMKN